MPFIYKHRRPPEPWHAFQKSALHKYLLPLYYANWLGEWVAYSLGKWSVFEVLEYVGSFSILIAVIFYFADAGSRLKQKHYQAWQVINTAQGKGGNGGRIDALQELNADHVPLVGIDVSDAYLQDLKLIDADLRRSEMRGVDLRHAILRNANLEGANLRSSNLRNAQLTAAKFPDASFFDADLAESNLELANLDGTNFERADLRSANLRDVQNWKKIRSIRLANIHGITAAPDGFAQWAKDHGAVDLPDDDEWEKALSIEAATRPSNITK